MDEASLTKGKSKKKSRRSEESTASTGAGIEAEVPAHEVTTSSGNSSVENNPSGMLSATLATTPGEHAQVSCAYRTQNEMKFFNATYNEVLLTLHP